MENKNNFAGIIIPVIVAVVLLTVLPIVNSINVECPPCEECPSYDIGQLNINPNFSSGDYIVDKGSYDYIDSATIIKDVDLIPENIKKGVNIFGVVGTLESAEEGFVSGNVYAYRASDTAGTATIGGITVPTSPGETVVTTITTFGTGTKTISVNITDNFEYYVLSIVVMDETGGLRYVKTSTSGSKSLSGSANISSTDLIFITMVGVGV